MADVICEDCIAEGVTNVRKPALDKDANPVPKKRCVTHWREEKKRRRKVARTRRVETVYRIPDSDYAALLDAQSGKCPCGNRPSCVDHEHNKPGCDHPPDTGCYRCIRGLLCDTCNRILLGRYSSARLRAVADYADNPPARTVLANPFDGS